LQKFATVIAFKQPLLRVFVLLQLALGGLGEKRLVALLANENGCECVDWRPETDRHTQSEIVNF
jgi:hypothetical protein